MTRDDWLTYARLEWRYGTEAMMWEYLLRWAGWRDE